jgi:hypothetical protein
MTWKGCGMNMLKYYSHTISEEVEENSRQISLKIIGFLAKNLIPDLPNAKPHTCNVQIIP